MPTRLDVLLQRRKSAAADPFHRQATANDRAGIKAAPRRFAVWGGKSESLGIIAAKLYQDIDGFAWGWPGGQADFRMRVGPLVGAKALKSGAIFASRCGKICDSFLPLLKHDDLRCHAARSRDQGRNWSWQSTTKPERNSKPQPFGAFCSICVPAPTCRTSS